MSAARPFPMHRGRPKAPDVAANPMRSAEPSANPAQPALLAPSAVKASWNFTSIPATVSRYARDGRAAVGPAPGVVRQAISGAGKGLDADVRLDMEARLGASIGNIRVHDDAVAAKAAETIGAEAFTIGADIAFNAGRFRPREAAGRRLLAHELVHTLQQGGAVAGEALGMTPPGHASEVEADRIADAAVGRGVPSTRASSAPLAVARQSKPETPQPVDKYSGAKVSAAMISLARGRITFQTSLGAISGAVDTDLKPGSYMLEAQPAQKRWVITSGNARTGLRFSVYLDDALPWTLSYPGKIPLLVATGETSQPKTFGDMIDPKTGALKDPQWLQEGAPGVDPVKGIDDFDAVRYDLDYRSEKGGLSKFLRVRYRDNNDKDINIDTINASNPRLMAAKMEALKIMDEYNTMFILGSFPAIFFIITINPIVAPVDGATRLSTIRRVAPRRGAAGGGGGSHAEAAPKDAAPPPGPEANGAAPRTGETQAPPEAAPAEAAPKVAEGEVPVSGPDLMKKTARLSGTQAEKVQYFEKNLQSLKPRWKAEKMGTATDGSIIYKGAKQARALAIKPNGDVYTGTWQEDVHFGFDGNKPKITCDWGSPGWKKL